MIILPDGAPLNLDAEISSSSDLISKLSFLKSSCDAFLDDSPASLSSFLETIHVVQGEFAEIPLTEDIKIVGSSDATTCCIVVLIDQPTRRALVCHHDESTVQYSENITMQGIVSGMKSPDLYLLGGALTAYGGAEASMTTFTTLLRCLHSLPIPIKLKLFCALEWNTDPIQRAPRFQSLAVAVSQHNRPPVVVAGPPGGWHDRRGPLIIPRLAQIWLDYGAQRPLRSVYDAEKDQWAIKLLEGETQTQTDASSSGRARKITPSATWIDPRILDLSDSELLRCCSTSPDCELPHIAGEIRKCLQWALAQVPPLQLVEHRFQFNKATNCWNELLNE